ncbi:TatD related DNase [compost metagenome]
MVYQQQYGKSIGIDADNDTKRQCYRKNWILAKQLIDKGYYLSIGVHCLDGSQDEVVKNIPLAHLFLETDTDTATEIATLYQYVAQVRSIPVEMLKQALYHNYKIVLKK